MKEYFYYLRDKMNKPMVTICLLTDTDIKARGVSICSLHDSPCKKTGRAIARGRALRALKRESAGDPINRSEPYHVLVHLNNASRGARIGLMLSNGKYIFNPILTLYERKLLNL